MLNPFRYIAFFTMQCNGVDYAWAFEDVKAHVTRRRLINKSTSFIVNHVRTSVRSSLHFYLVKIKTSIDMYSVVESV